MSPNDRANAERIRQQAASAARQVHEITVASAAVISERLTIGAKALHAPSIAAATEAGTMIAEKAGASLASGVALARSSVAFAAEASSYALRETASLGGGIADLAGSRSPIEAGLVQGEAAARFFGRALSHSLALTALSMDMGLAALNPFHAGVVANAKRLKPGG
ncbi:MAG: hypothetical protein Q8M88_13170 [Phenylobacterium sp.]|uniref:hypothetical protein n=1 Tax=Phenylobacterium sp. TaxID=1871053 RepID=UPI0027335B92|nr:hypothetical protein [Phenylobacterium sp.]MDP3175377.1 hypothetical protein [Phenylobacterium sp.]